jgi:hypothetical protein
MRKNAAYGRQWTASPAVQTDTYVFDRDLLTGQKLAVAFVSVVRRIRSHSVTCARVGCVFYIWLVELGWRLGHIGKVVE